MAFTPISNTVPQYEENGVAASGYFIKFYESGTTTPTAMATDSTGTTLLDKCELNTEGYPVNGSSAVFIPHINKKYKIALFRNAADADANDLASAAWPAVDGLLPVVTVKATYIEGVDSVSDIEGLIAELDNQQISLKGWHPDSNVGGGILYWDAAKPKSEHNGGTVFSPTVPFSVDGSYNTALGETDASGSGCWVRTVKGQIQTTDFGMGFGGDDSPRWQSLLDCSEVGSVNFKYTGSSYLFLSSSICNRNLTITSDKGVIIDCTSPSYAGGNWTGFSGSISGMAGLGLTAQKGARTVTFSQAHGLTAGDVFIIFNPTTSSWSAYRSVYFAGEFCKVVSVSGNTVTVARGLYDTYSTSDVSLYKLNPIKVSIKGLTIHGSLSQSLLDLEFCKDSSVSEMECKHGNNSCIAVKRSYSISVNDVSVFNAGDGGDDYGVVITNSQSVRISNSYIYARRHAVATGGDAQTCAVPCRDVRTSNSTLNNDINSGTHCADFHGNTEDSKYVDCVINGGATWQGKDNGYIDCVMSNTLSGACILSAEIVGGTLYARGCTFHTDTDPSDTGRGVIDVGGNSLSIREHTVEDVTFEVSNGSVNCDVLSDITAILVVRNSGSLKKINISVEGVNLNVNKLGQVVTTRFDAGVADSDFIIVDKVVAGKVDSCYLVNYGSSGYDAFPKRLQSQSGSVQLTPTAGASVVTGNPILLKWKYWSSPDILVARNAVGYLGNRVGIAFADPVAGDRLTPNVATDDSTGFAAALPIKVSWRVGVDEV